MKVMDENNGRQWFFVMAPWFPRIVSFDSLQSLTLSDSCCIFILAMPLRILYSLCLLS